MKYVIQEQMVVEDVGSGQISWDRNCPKIVWQIFPIVVFFLTGIEGKNTCAFFSNIDIVRK